MQPVRITRQPTDRRGIVLILALGMLTLFTIVAITLASISRTQSTAAGNFKRLEQYGSNALTVRDAQVNDLFRYALNQLVYDTRNRQSAIRGHSLLRDMYGSPTKYTLTSDPTDSTGYKIQSLSAVTGDGAELRLKHNDLRRLLNIPLNNNSDPRLMALNYQKVYNGTGLFVPRKIDFTTGLTFTAGTGTTGFENLYLKNAEIAAQLAFMNVPGKLMPSTPTNYPSNGAGWKQILLNPFGTVPTGASYWLPLFPLNYTEYDAFMPNTGTVRRAATGGAIDPERFTYVSSVGTAGVYPLGDHWFGADEDYDYPDINNMYLAMERADGKMLIPSFHRPGIIAQVADGVNTLTSHGATGEFIGKLPWMPYNSGATSGNPPADFRGLVLRPRAADRDAATLGVTSPRAGKFREMADSYVGPVVNNVPGQDGLPDDLDGSGFIGDHPSELDVDTDGDGLNDSIWVDLGHPVIQVGDTAVKPLFAFKVVGMDGKINLNLAGNLYKAPDPTYSDPMNTNPLNKWGASGGIHYTIQHKSNLGASPTEINPQYGFILGDNGGPSSYSLTNTRPPSPIWGYIPPVPPATDPFLNPYLRLLEGYTNLYTGDQAGGRWTGSAGTRSLPGRDSADDNGNLTDPNPLNADTIKYDESFYGSAIATAKGYDYSQGDGQSPIANLFAKPAGYPAIYGELSPVDFYGIGTKYSPLSHTAMTQAAMKLVPNEGNMVPGYLNYVAASTATLGAKIANLIDGSAPTTVPLTITNLGTTSGIPVQQLLANEATETNVYNPVDDSLFTAADIATLLRANDFDGSANQSRLVTLLPDQLGRRSVDVSVGGGAQAPTPTYYSSESYGKRRMQNLFTHESWDLIRFNAPPFLHSSSSAAGSGLGLFLGPVLPSSSGELLELFGNSLVGLGNGNPVESYLARSHSGEAGPNFISQLLNYRLPVNSLTSLTPTSGSYVVTRDIYEQLALTPIIINGVAYGDFLIPYEVQMGRRMDLNRPLTAYIANNATANTNADFERSAFAQQIYVLLAMASGACGLDPSTTNLMSPQARLAQSRVLAQIAVNIVDYMDPDSVMTIMRFDPDLSDGWDDPTISSPKAIVDSSSGAAIASYSTNPNEYTSITTVMGFELPQLVISETMAVVVEDNSNASSSPPIRDEYLLNWIELFNPWPDTIDPVDGGQGTALFDNGANKQPIFMLQINRLNTLDPDCTDVGNAQLPLFDFPPFDFSLPPKDSSPLTPQSQLVLFNGTTASAPSAINKKGASTVTIDGGLSNGTISARVSGRLGSGSASGTSAGYFVVGPMNVTMKNPNTSFVIPTIKNDYTASACAFVWEGANKSSSEPQIDIRLYRLRNPFVAFNSTSNPYIAIDSVSQQAQQIPSVRSFNQRMVDSSNQNEAQIADPPPSISPQKTGFNYVKDLSIQSDPSVQPDWTSTPQLQSVTPPAYVSSQRRQPWHGYNADWRPYLVGATPGAHPLMGTLLNVNNQNLEGAFLGLPSLSNPTRYYSSVLIPPISATGSTIYSNQNVDNAMRQNGFSPETPSFGSVNNKAYMKWESFPFPNRQLASPLELLSLRLYGSHLWFLKGGNSSCEWRLRFTDDCEFFPHPWRLNSSVMPGGSGGDFYERLWRTRQVPWYQDSRVSHPTFPQVALPTSSTVPLLPPTNPAEVQLPLPHLYRFFEFVECRSRMNNGVPANQQWVSIAPSWPTEMQPGSSRTVTPTRGSGTPPVAVTLPTALPASVFATQRSERTPGKMNLNLITEEEIYRALLDSVETAYYDLIIDHLNLDGSGHPQGNLAFYASGGNYSIAISQNYWPVNYWFTTTTAIPGAGALFSALGQVPLGNPGTPSSPTKVLDVIDAIGRMVPWSSLTLNNTTSATVTTPPLAKPTSTPPVLSTGGFDIGTARLFGTTVLTTSLPVLAANSMNLSNPSTTSPNILGSPNLQFPGIVNGPDPLAILFPGTDPNRQVHSEMYRAFLLSRSGPDGVHGTADDKPFRSFAADDVSDTILRVRNSATNGLVKEGAAYWDTTTSSLLSPTVSDAQSIVAQTYLDGSDDLVSLSTGAISFYVGDYITRLGGQRIPGLFDPISDPYSDYVLPLGTGTPKVYASIPHLWPIGADPGAATPDTSVDFQSRLPTDPTGKLDSMSLSPKLPADYWALEERRNELLAKISGNVTTRSHVYAAWVTVGFFRVEPGTEGLKVPLLGAEVGSESGKTFRHRAFFIIDRSQAKSYDPEDIDANFELDVMRQNKLLEYYKVIE